MRVALHRGFPSHAFRVAHIVALAVFPAWDVEGERERVDLVTVQKRLTSKLYKLESVSGLQAPATTWLQVI